MRKFRVMASLRSRRIALAAALLLIAGVFPLNASYVEDPHDYYKVFYDSGDGNCGVMSCLYRWVPDESFTNPGGFWELVGCNCLG